MAGVWIFVKIWPPLQDLHKYGPNILGHVSLYLKIWPYTYMTQTCGDVNYINVTAQHRSHDNSPHRHVAYVQSKGLTHQLIRSGREGIGRLGIKFMAHEPKPVLHPPRPLLTSYIAPPSYIAPTPSPSYILHSPNRWK